VAADVDEFRLAGLEKAACRNIAVARVAASPIAIECVLSHCLPLRPASGLPCQTTLVVGEVVGIHIDAAILRDGRIDTTRLQPLARLGYMDYAAIDTTFEMLRPVPQEASSADHR
jgi:flavin reductase (DIM6/NTAB) family NADH-FMN oxidoreductase RutF